MHYFSFNVGDHAQATGHLSPLEAGVHIRLERRYYAEEKPLVDDLAQLCRWVGARTEEERQAVSQVLKEFFELRDDGWHHAHADEEIQKYRERAAVNRANGRRSPGRPRKQPAGIPTETHSVFPENPSLTESQPSCTPSATLTKNQQPETISPQAPKGELPTGFSEFWAVYPNRDAKQDAIKAYRALAPKPELLATILADITSRSQSEAWTKEDGKFIPLPATYLRGKRWEDQGVTAKAAVKQWWDSQSGIRSKGDQLRVPYSNTMASGGGWLRYVAAVWVAAGDGPHWDEKSSVYPLAVGLRNQSAGGISLQLEGLGLRLANPVKTNVNQIDTPEVM